MSGRKDGEEERALKGDEECQGVREQPPREMEQTMKEKQ